MICPPFAALRSSGSVKRQRDSRSAGTQPAVPHSPDAQPRAEDQSMEAPGSHAAPEKLVGKAGEQAGFQVRRLLAWHIFECMSFQTLSQHA